MADLISIHPDSPQARLIERIVERLKAGEVAVLPTDACFVLACHLDDPQAIDRLRRIRGLDDKHHLTLLCADLSKVAHYAQVNNVQYRLLKRVTPGPYTFILPASKLVPKRICHPKRKTIGLRIPDHQGLQMILAALDDGLVSTTLQLPKDTLPLSDVDEIMEKLEKQVDFVVDMGGCGLDPTTLVELNDEEISILRLGCGDVDKLG